ncbi:DUF4280 domain-containing protein [Chryseobacterium luteum]|uniref:DUF4280 domain-containing protein n=1 Tax=Chryseobacterium luteum TaxID=421531 RepID=A0A085ZH48_9FLAO|nr:DUF4280 domain-containing protein [Chryseobacterium luteum]KFF03762.1 hypothetical protein IX38_10110 [Chryseobacterium luteum]
MEDQNTSAHDRKLSEKRAEKQKKANEDSPLEKREMVLHGAKLKCPYAQAPGKLKVTSNEINLQDKLFATEGDGNNMVNLKFKGTCGHPKWPAKNMSPPPCMSVIKLSPWQNLGSTVVQKQTVLVKESFIFCDPTPNVAFAKPIPMEDRILALLDDVYTVSVYYNDVKIDPESFVFISSEPAMPKIRIEVYIGKDCIHKSLRFRLKTEFKFTASATLYDRNDVDYFPAKSDGGNAFMIANKGKTKWDVDFRGLFRGGTATVEIWNEAKTSVLSSFQFYIRGKNPTKEVIKKYMNDKGYLKYWPVYRMILHESGSEFHPVVRQFWDPEFVGKGESRKEAVYGPSGRVYESKGIPNYGEPDGWGMCQIDFTYEKREKTDQDYITRINKNPNYIWNWKENLSIKMDKKISDKLDAAKKYLEKLLKKCNYSVKPTEQKEGNLTYKWCPTTIPGLSHLNRYMPQKADNSSVKSLLDAEFIKLYNGGHYLSNIDSNGNATFKNYEEYKGIKIYYVKKISDINE